MARDALAAALEPVAPLRRPFVRWERAERDPVPLVWAVLARKVPSSSSSPLESLPSSRTQTQSRRTATADDDEEDEDEDAALASGAAGLSVGDNAAEEEDDEEEEEEEEEEEDTPISPARYEVFRKALGQLLNTPLFEDDSADVNELIDGVNRKIGGSGGGAFERDEAVKALKEMDAKNQIMYVSPLPVSHPYLWRFICNLWCFIRLLTFLINRYTVVNYHHRDKA